jgi:hypothetical protein
VITIYGQNKKNKTRKNIKIINFIIKIYCYFNQLKIESYVFWKNNCNIWSSLIPPHPSSKTTKEQPESNEYNWSTEFVTQIVLHFWHFWQHTSMNICSGKRYFNDILWAPAYNNNTLPDTGISWHYFDGWKHKNARISELNNSIKLRV